MTDQQIIDRIDFIHNSDYGRRGYEIVISPSSMSLYENELILVRFSGYFATPIGPFKNKIVLSAIVVSSEKEYNLFFKREFRTVCTEQKCIVDYVTPFLSLLRQFVNNRIDESTIWRSYEGYNATVKNLESEEKRLVPNWLNNLKQGKVLI